jgi:uncharacterized protein YdeI (YjbR/CyaY-like superfamily)
MEPLFFATSDDWRAWLEANHATGRELWVGFYKRSSGKPSITWPESVDEALCFGWIDGIRKRAGEISYTIRFTPRRATSTWSAVNIRRVAELQKQGRMRSPGQTAFEKRMESKSGIYSHERGQPADQVKLQTLTRKHQAALKANRKAWEFFRVQAPWYRRAAAFWINSAKRPETQHKRLETLIRDSARCRPIPPLDREKG